MLSLAFERRHRVLRITVSGIFASEDLDELDNAVIAFVARHGQARGIIDCTDAEAFAVPESRLAQRVQQPPILQQEKVIVAARVAGAGARTYGLLQRDAGRKEAAVVDTLDEAYALLGLKNPRFEPIEG